MESSAEQASDSLQEGLSQSHQCQEKKREEHPDENTTEYETSMEKNGLLIFGLNHLFCHCAS